MCSVLGSEGRSGARVPEIRDDLAKRWVHAGPSWMSRFLNMLGTCLVRRDQAWGNLLTKSPRHYKGKMAGYYLGIAVVSQSSKMRTPVSRLPSAGSSHPPMGSTNRCFYITGVSQVPCVASWVRLWAPSASLGAAEPRGCFPRFHANPLPGCWTVSTLTSLSKCPCHVTCHLFYLREARLFNVSAILRG
jgi:hypothetical protein